MGRRHREAIEHYALSGMRTAVAIMASKMAQIKPLILTHEEVLDVIAPKEHHAILREAATIAAVDSDNEEFGVNVPHDMGEKGLIGLTMCMHDVGDKTAPLRPRHPSYLRTPETVETRLKIHNWIDWRLEIGREFGVVQYALNILAAKCTKAEEVRFLFPSVLALCSPQDNGYDMDLQAFHDKVRDFIAPRHLPSLTPSERKAIREAAGYISAASMLPKEVTDNGECPLEVTIAISEMPVFLYGDDSVPCARVNS